MCGIAGVYKFNNSQVVSENEIKKMSRRSPADGQRK